MKNKTWLLIIFCLCLFFSKAGATAPICVGDTMTAYCADSFLLHYPGGSWSSSNIDVVTVDPETGVITATGAGTAIITYTVTTGCGTFTFTIEVTVNPLPAVITGTAEVCVGQTTTLYSATPGGTWSSGSPGVATIGAATGIVTGISAGTSVMSYTIETGCKITRIVTVDPLPVITGDPGVCVGSTNTLGTTIPGGTWSSSDPDVVSVNSSGVITGVEAGTAIITYISPAGCMDTALVEAGAPFDIHVCEVYPIATCDSIISYCDSLVLKVSGTPGTGAATYTWTAPISATSTISGDGTYALFSFTTPPATGNYTVAAKYNGCTERAQKYIVTAAGGTCYPCAHFKPCVTECTGCDTVPYFKTVIGRTITGTEVSTTVPANYYIANDITGGVANDTLRISPAAGSIFYMGENVQLIVDTADDITISNCHLFASLDCKWLGIRVLLGQYDPGAGKLTLNNNTLIEHVAKEGGGARYFGAVTVNPAYVDPNTESSSATPGNLPLVPGDIIRSDGAIYNQNRIGIFISFFSNQTTLPFTIQGSVFTNRDFCGYHTETESPGAGDYYPFQWPHADYLRTPVVDETGNDPAFNIDAFSGMPAHNDHVGGWGLYLEQVGQVDSSSYPFVYSSMQVGNPNVNDSTNLFDTLINDVNIIGSDVVFYNNIFRHTLHTNDGVGIRATNESPTTLQLLRGNQDATYNRFYNVQFGVNCYDCYRVESDSTRMSSTNYYVSDKDNNITGEIGFDMLNSRYDMIAIHHSAISNIQKAIYIGDGAGNCENGVVNVYRNTITGLTSGSSYECGFFAIEATDNNVGCSLYSGIYSGSLNVTANLISGYIWGIKVSGSLLDSWPDVSILKTTIDSNTVIIRNNDATNPYPNKIGVYCEYLFGLVSVSANAIYGDTTSNVDYNTPSVVVNPGTGSSDPSGIDGFVGIKVADMSNDVADPPANLTNLECNYIHDLGVGFDLVSSTKAHWRNNVMMRNSYGFMLERDGINDVGGICDPSDNVWGDDGTGTTTGWPGWLDGSVYETFTVKYDPSGYIWLYVRPDPNPGFPPYYVPTNNGTATCCTVASAALSAPSTIIVDVPGDCETFPDTARCAPVSGPLGPVIEEERMARGVTDTHAGSEKEQHYAISPNPSNGDVLITQQYPDNTEVAVKVMNYTGAVIYSGSLSFSDGAAGLKIAKVVPGIYLVEIGDRKGGSAKFKVVIEK